MDLFDASFYWGRITRQDAEDLLEQFGLKNGSYLIREKYEEAGAYAITLCFSKRFYHYRIDRLPNDNVVLSGSRAQEKFALTNDRVNVPFRGRLERNSEQMEFPGPIELINYFQKVADPLVTTLSIPCNRPYNYNFIQFWCVPLLTPELYQNKIFQEAYNTDRDIPIKLKVTSKRYIYERRVLKTLHESEPWFHSRICRYEAEIRLKHAGGKSGLFLVREKANDKRSRGCFSLSLCFQREYHHYIIQQTSSGHLQVACANKATRVTQFGSIVQLIDYYYRHQQDIACSLRYPCTRPGGSVRILPYPDFFKGDSVFEDSDPSDTDQWSLATPEEKPIETPFDFTSPTSPPTSDAETSPDLLVKENFFIDDKYLIFADKLGEGHFGAVYSGKLIGNQVNNNGISRQTLQHVAIKQIRHQQISLAQDLYNEGERMLQLDHPYIVKLLGISKHEDRVSLILELCPYGAMNRWLKLNKTFRMEYILNYMYQVSDGMNYLHEKNIIHRDLALRNILIMSKTVCKISDFGLSRFLEENSYYQIGQNRRLPSMWYPPEVLETALFHSQIDIWSFGVTVWEATSYGQTPYKTELEAMIGGLFEPISQKLSRFLRSGHRLKQPANCPNDIYALLLKCWEYDKHNRPSLVWIREYLRQYAFPEK